MKGSKITRQRKVRPENLRDLGPTFHLNSGRRLILGSLRQSVTVEEKEAWHIFGRDGMEGIQVFPHTPGEEYKTVTIRVRVSSPWRGDYTAEARGGQPECGLRCRILLKRRQSAATSPTSACEGRKTHRRKLTKKIRQKVSHL